VEQSAVWSHAFTLELAARNRAVLLVSPVLNGRVFEVVALMPMH